MNINKKNSVKIAIPTNDGINRFKERGMKLFFKKGNIQEALINVIREEGSDVTPKY